MEARKQSTLAATPQPVWAEPSPAWAQPLARAAGSSEGWLIGGLLAGALIVFVTSWMSGEVQRRRAEGERRVKAVMSILLPVEIWRPAEVLTATELRARCERLSVSPELERSEAITAIAERTDNICAICQESFCEGERLRSLQHCRHCYHAECLEKWVLLETSKGRVPHCPTCNTQLCQGCATPSCPSSCPLCSARFEPSVLSALRARELTPIPPSSNASFGSMKFPYSLLPNVCVLAMVVALHLAQN